MTGPAKRIGSGETAYSLEDAKGLRESIIALRDAALNAGEMEWAVSLSHTVAFMAVALREIWGDEIPEQKGSDEGAT